MRPSSWPSPLPWTALALLGGLGLAACQVDVPALECVRDSQCRLGQRCQAQRCVTALPDVAPGDQSSDPGGDAPEDVPTDLAGDGPEGDGGDPAGDPDAADAPIDDGGSDLADAPAEDAPDAAADIRPDLPDFDPAPALNTPGSWGCEGAPAVDLAGHDPDAYQFLLGLEPNDAFDIGGVVTGASGNGTWFVRQPGGGQAVGPFAVNPDGSFRAVVPVQCSAVDSNVVKLVWENATCERVVVLDVQADTCYPQDVHVGLWWNPQGDDLDLHLVRESGELNNGDDDCNNGNCIGGGPDWGPIGPVGNPFKNFDSGSGGSEDIVVADAAGVYTVLVERWGENPAVPSDVSLIASISQYAFVTLRLELNPRHVWVAAEIDVETGRWRPLGIVVDCSEAWDEEIGCMLPLPE